MRFVTWFAAGCGAFGITVSQPAWCQVVSNPAIPSAPSPMVITGVDGDWDGTLEVGAIKLRLIFHMVSTPGTGTTATIDSIDQGAKGIPVTAVSKTGDKLLFDIKVIQGSFEGSLSADGRSIVGTWRQGPNTLPLTLMRRAAGAAAPTANRSQTPVRPFPYREE